MSASYIRLSILPSSFPLFLFPHIDMAIRNAILLSWSSRIKRWIFRLRGTCGLSRSPNFKFASGQALLSQNQRGAKNEYLTPHPLENKGSRLSHRLRCPRNICHNPANCTAYFRCKYHIQRLQSIGRLVIVRIAEVARICDHDCLEPSVPKGRVV